MEHKKTYHSITKDTSYGNVVIEGPVPSDRLKNYHFDEGLTAFRPAPKQFEALLQIANFPEGRIIIARHNHTIIGYVTYLHPDPLERWSTFEMPDLLVLGAVEVTERFRQFKIASSLLEVSMMDEFMENYIIISTEYYWHWDLRGTGLNVWQYRKVMEKMMAYGDLKPSTTDDPEIISHPANCLMVRIGKNVPQSSIDTFNTLRFLSKHRRKQ
ncbi:acetoin utilization protein AcuA [Cerasibacillus quisquiliarum]|uniref:Acetoin utilization protein AcuA n=1 Tax=Cerasibacillus quisquiliarum TaxID=227865 RepID=A0A511V050_9BACI|nr:N-acetyltransferase [Cerasibacillus quisquiliarum]MBB5147353.1 acetoin utilization protein AcuA [Cerasibacillus quisquiliarum]GEN32287.1 acetoin utilization protein AcuA [Cerasibacillus quisquiliarum]